MFDNIEEIKHQLESENLQTFEKINELNEDVKLFKVQLKGKGPIASRFLTSILCWFELEDGVYGMSGCSIENAIPDQAMPAGCVRGNLMLTVYIWKPHGDCKDKTLLQ
jgi:hypothetical protein